MSTDTTAVVALVVASVALALVLTLIGLAWFLARPRFLDLEYGFGDHRRNHAGRAGHRPPGARRTAPGPSTQQVPAVDPVVPREPDTRGAPVVWPDRSSNRYPDPIDGDATVEQAAARPDPRSDQP